MAARSAAEVAKRSAVSELPQPGLDSLRTPCSVDRPSVIHDAFKQADDSSRRPASAANVVRMLWGLSSGMDWEQGGEPAFNPGGRLLPLLVASPFWLVLDGTPL